MVSGLRGGEFRFGGGAGLFDGGDDVRVRAAAAEIAAHRPLDLFCRGRCCLPEQRVQAHDLARRAVATLEAIRRDECFLQRVQLVTVTDSLDGSDLLVSAIDGRTGFR